MQQLHTLHTVYTRQEADKIMEALEPSFIIAASQFIFFANTYNLGFDYNDIRVYVPSSQEIFAENRIVHLS